MLAASERVWLAKPLSIPKCWFVKQKRVWLILLILTVYLYGSYFVSLLLPNSKTRDVEEVPIAAIGKVPLVEPSLWVKIFTVIQV